MFLASREVYKKFAGRASGAKLGLAMLMLFSLSSCDINDPESWNERKPQNFDEYMERARSSLAQGKSEKAIQLYTDGMHEVEAMYGSQDPRIATAAEELGDLEDKLGKEAEAEASYRKALAVLSKNLSPKSRDVIDVRKKLAAVLMKLYRSDEAKAVLAGASDQGKGSNAPRVRRHRRKSE